MVKFGHDVDSMRFLDHWQITSKVSRGEFKGDLEQFRWELAQQVDEGFKIIVF